MTIRPTLVAFAFVALIATAVELRLHAAAPDSVLPVQTLYADASAKEDAVRTALSEPAVAPTVLKAVRTVVGDFESIVRHYPASGYSDDALWRAARLSLDGFKLYGEARDRDAAVRLLGQLASQYPFSKFAKQAPALSASAASLRPTITSPRPSTASIHPSTASLRPSAADRETPAENPQPPTAPKAAALQRATIKNIERVVLSDVVRVIIELDDEVPFHDERLDNPKRVFVDLKFTRPATALLDRTLRFTSDSAPVRQIRLGRQTDGTARVVLDAADVAAYSVYQLYAPYRLVIDCAITPSIVPSKPAGPVALLTRRSLGPTWAQALPPASLGASVRILDVLSNPPQTVGTGGSEPLRAAPIPARPTVSSVAPQHSAGGFTVARQLGLGVSRIVIDPGHGGHDPGAQYSGLDEAEMVLDISLRLEQLLLKLPGTEVVLTRRTDDFVSLQERTAIANREGADLFLSIHGNANASPQVGGIETYFLNFASTLSAASVAARENAASGQAMAALPDYVKAIALNNKVDESRELATLVQRTMIEKLKGSNKTVKDLGVKQAPFVVLIGAAMPSVLTEVSFVTNAQDSRLLKTPAYRQRIADALFTAVRKYQASLTSVSTIAGHASQ